MEAFVYISGRAGVAIDELEDAFDELLDGRGEVTGTGTGEKGSNIDLEIRDGELGVSEVVELCRSCLARLNVATPCEVNIDGSTQKVQ